MFGHLLVLDSSVVLGGGQVHPNFEVVHSETITPHMHRRHTSGLGTPTYASPEQLAGSDYDEKTDIFSTGMVPESSPHVKHWWLFVNAIYMSDYYISDCNIM